MQLTFFLISHSFLPLKISPPFWSTDLHQIIWRKSPNEALFVILFNTRGLKCHTMYNQLFITEPCRSNSPENKNMKEHNVLHFPYCCIANLYSRIADKPSKGSNSNTSKNGSILSLTFLFALNLGLKKLGSVGWKIFLFFV